MLLIQHAACCRKCTTAGHRIDLGQYMHSAIGLYVGVL